MADKNITMKEKTVDGYDILYPETLDAQVKLNQNAIDRFELEDGANLKDALEKIPNENDAGFVRYNGKLYEISVFEDSKYLFFRPRYSPLAFSDKYFIATKDGSQTYYDRKTLRELGQTTYAYHKGSGTIMPDLGETDNNIVVLRENGGSHYLNLINWENRNFYSDVVSGAELHYSGVKNSYVYLYCFSAPDDSIKVKRIDYDTMTQVDTRWQSISLNNIASITANTIGNYIPYNDLVYGLELANNILSLITVNLESRTATKTDISIPAPSTGTLSKVNVLFANYDTNEIYFSFGSTIANMIGKINWTTFEYTELLGEDSTQSFSSYFGNITENKLLVNGGNRCFIVDIDTKEIIQISPSTIVNLGYFKKFFMINGKYAPCQGQSIIIDLDTLKTVGLNYKDTPTSTATPNSNIYYSNGIYYCLTGVNEYSIIGNSLDDSMFSYSLGAARFIREA